MAPQAQPHTRHRHPKATCLRSNTDLLRLLQLLHSLVCLTPFWRHCSEYFTLPCGFSWTCGHRTMPQLHCSCRHCTGYRCANILHISVHIDVCCCLWLCSYLSTRRRRTSFDATRKSASAVSRQWTVRHTTGVIVSQLSLLLVHKHGIS